MLIFTHTFLRWLPRQWYFDQLIILSAITVCLAFALVRPKSELNSIANSAFERFSKDHLGRRVAITFGLVGSITCIALLESWMLYQAPYPHQIEMLDAAKWLETNLRQDEIASSFNTGIMGFFSQRRVVNLDGIMNASARTALEQRMLSRLMRTSGIRYYVDYEPLMLEMYSAFLGLENEPMPMVLVQEIDEPGVAFSGARIRAYRLDWPLE